MLASDPASILNQNYPDLGIPNRFNPKESDSKTFTHNWRSVGDGWSISALPTLLTAEAPWATKSKSPDRSGLQHDVIWAAALATCKAEAVKYACRQKRSPLTNKRTIG